MDQERPRSHLSINSRNDLRKALHLEFLYKENKVRAFQVWRPVLELSLGNARALVGPAEPAETGGGRRATPAVRKVAAPGPAPAWRTAHAQREARPTALPGGRSQSNGT